MRKVLKIRSGKQASKLPKRLPQRLALWSHALDGYVRKEEEN
jgi:hypothetical protein